MNQENIEKPWCIYEGCFIDKTLTVKLIEKFTGKSCNICGVGKIIEIHKSSFGIITSENEKPQRWQDNEISEWRYSKLEEAIEICCACFKKSYNKTLEKYKKNFPSYFKEKSENQFL